MEYPNSNLPQVIRSPDDESLGMNAYLEQNYIFLGVAYWKQAPELMSRVFDNPTPSDAVTYAEVHLFIPRQRLVWQQINTSGGGGPGPTPLGGVPGQFVDLPPGRTAELRRRKCGRRKSLGRRPRRRAHRLGPPHPALDLPIDPGHSAALATILQTVPTLPAFGGANFTPPKSGRT